MEIRVLKDEKIPDHTTLFYRANQIDRETLQKCIKYTAVQIIVAVGKIDKIIVDGTGFRYDETYKLTWERGKRLKEVKSHVKTGVLVATKEEIVMPIAVRAGKPYSDERKLFKEDTKGDNFRGGELCNRRQTVWDGQPAGKDNDRGEKVNTSDTSKRWDKKQYKKSIQEKIKGDI